MAELAHFQLSQALNVIAPEDKAAYLEAATKVPGLVQKESNFVSFFRCDRGDSDNACRRLIAYWQMRCEIFQERAFLPLNLLGNGALTSDEVDLLQQGSVVLLPADSAKRSVVFLDYSKCPEICKKNRNVWMRLIFYLLHLVSESEKAQSEGFIVLCRAINVTAADLPLESVLALSDLMLNSFHAQAKRIHVIVPPRTVTTNSFMSGVLKRLGSSLGGKVVFHLLDEETATRDQLHSYGLIKEGLPTCFGGTWSHELFERILLTRNHQDLVNEQLRVTAKRDAERTESFDGLKEVLNEKESLKSSGENLKFLSKEGTEFVTILKDLNEAMTLLPESLIKVYKRALKDCPEVVERESHPLTFLRFEYWDPWAAASRLATYWMERFEIFGKKAFLPMVGGAALQGSDLQVINRNSLLVLPNHKTGRSVLYMDRSRVPFDSKSTRPQKLRMLFACLTELSRNSMSQEEGFCLLARLCSEGPSGFDRYVLTRSLDLVRKAFPIRIAKAVFINIAQEGVKRTLLKSFVPFWIKLLGPAIRDMAQFIFCETGPELLLTLESDGFKADAIPQDLGGSWTPEEHAVTKSSHVVSATEQFKMSARSRLEDAISIIPEDKKAAYLEAKARCSHLVQTESNSSYFLRREAYDVWAAAKRLVAYWDERKKIFGERAFRLMILTGEGALSLLDIEVFKTGYLVLLPADYNGRAVICYDPSRLSSYCRETRLRCLFYVMTIACEYEKTFEEGFIGMAIINKSGFQRTLGLHGPQDLVSRALPVKLAGSHVVHCPRQIRKEWFLERMLPVLMRLVSKATTRVVAHAGGSREEQLHGILAVGLEKEGLPTTIGGTWSYDSDFPQWIADRVQSERVRYNLIPAQSLTPANAPEDREETRKRKMGAIYSRRKRARQREKLDSLHTKSYDLSSRNDALRREGSRLEKLLERAKHEVGVYQVTSASSGATDIAIKNFTASRAASLFQTSFFPRNIVEQQAPSHVARDHTLLGHSVPTSLKEGSKRPPSMMSILQSKLGSSSAVGPFEMTYGHQSRSQMNPSLGSAFVGTPWAPATTTPSMRPTSNQQAVPYAAAMTSNMEGSTQNLDLGSLQGLPSSARIALAKYRQQSREDQGNQ